MLQRLRRAIAGLRKNTSGNSALLVSLGLPALIGGAGLAVDTSQWYMWKRELQFAVDQAALAGAWSRTDNETKDNYSTRATQEFNGNVQTIRNFVGTPVITLINYNGGTANAVRVSASASRKLPFSSLLTGRSATVTAYAQASVTAGTSYLACLIALDETDTAGTIDFDGSITYMAACGVAALSTSDESIRANGIDPDNFDPGSIVSRGGVDSWFTENGYEVHTHEELYDPFASLSPPSTTNSLVSRTYGCAPAGTTTTATVATYVETWSYTYTGSRRNQVNTLATTVLNSTSDTATSDNQTVAAGSTNGTAPGSPVTTTTATGSVTDSGNSWQRIDTVTKTYSTYSNVETVTLTAAQATVVSGTYSTINVSCNTVFTGGVYVIDGGRLKITSQYDVTGSGVLFILKNGAYIDIAGGSNVNLTAMTETQLEAQGVSTTDAAALDGMLIFEDRASSGSDNRNSLAGNATTVLNGTIYLPRSNLTLAGTASVTTQCLTIAAYQVKIAGTADFRSFCPDGFEQGQENEVGSANGSVKLVS